jgi:phosphate-selective porin
VKRTCGWLVTALLLISTPALADDPAPPSTSPSSPAGYNVPVAQPPIPPDSHATVDLSPLAHDQRPLAGYHNGLFFLRDHHDNYHLYIQGRMQLDFYGYAGRGVPDTSLKPTLFIRRIRPEVSGEFLGHWRFMIAGDFGATAIDNPRGTNETSAAPPATAPTASNGRYSAAQTVRVQGAPTDAFINYRAQSYFNVMVGQMDAPFTLENRTSDKYLQFAERSLAVRAVGIPTNKEIGAMFWGETGNRLFYYSLGPYMGDGQNRPNVDSRFDLFSRVFMHPLAAADIRQTDAIRDLQVGASFHYGSRDHKWVDYDYAPMSTQAQWAFWTPIYTASNGPTHVIPSGDQIAVAGELRVPFKYFDITSELVYIHNGTREAQEGFQATNTERYGDIHGTSYYAQLAFWPLGNRDINGVPGYGNPPRLDYSQADPVTPLEALQLLAKWEQVNLAYRSASNSGVVDPKNMDGRIKVNAFSLGANYWATKHVRLTLDYILNLFPDSASTSTWTSANRAQAPGNTVAANVDNGARNHAHTLNEIVARFAIAL